MFTVWFVFSLLFFVVLCAFPACVRLRPTVSAVGIQKRNQFSRVFNISFLFLPRAHVDKQQEFDLPSLRIDENDISSALAAQKQRSRSPRFGGPPMSQISGVSRPLLAHTNSFTGERLPTFGVETPHENALGTLLGDIDTWGIDIFKIADLSLLRPLTCIAYTVFQVNHSPI